MNPSLPPPALPVKRPVRFGSTVTLRAQVRPVALRSPLFPPAAPAPRVSPLTAAIRQGRPIRVAALLLAVVAGSGAAHSQTPALPAAPVVRVEERTVPERFEFTGRITAVSHITLQARVSGYLSRVAFREGEMVSQGDVLFELAPRPFQARHAAAKADLQQAQAAEERARREAERGEVLRAAAALSEEEAQQRRSAHLGAEAARAAAEARLAEAALDLEFSQVRAPVTGRAGRAFVIPGHLVRGGDAAGTELTEIVTVDPMRILFEVDEPAYRRLHLAQAAGEPLAVEVRLADGTTHAARIDYLANLLNPATGTAEVRAILPNSAGALVPGLFARAVVQVGTGTGRLLVPEVAVGADQGGRYLLVVAPDGTVTYRRVRLGDRVGAERVVLEGLSAGESVIVNGLQRVRPGMKVQPVAAEAATVASR